jgi:hypothetical protein
MFDDMQQTTFDWIDQDTALESPDTLPSPATLRREARHRMVTKLKKEHAAEILNPSTFPAPGETVHILSNGKFDYWNLAPVAIDLLGGRSEHLYGSTWTMNRDNVLELLSLYDAGKIGSISILTGRYFARRESAVWAQLVTGLTDRGQRVLAFVNHAKVLLLQSGEHYLSITGSSNWTANPRVEQIDIHNSRAVWEFYRRELFERMLANG